MDIDTTPKRKIDLSFNVYEKRRLDLSSWKVELVEDNKKNGKITENTKFKSSVGILQTTKLMKESITLCTETYESEDCLADDILSKFNETCSDMKDKDEDTASILLQENIELIQELRTNYHNELEKRLEQEVKSQKLINALRMSHKETSRLSNDNDNLRHEIVKIRNTSESRVVKEKKNQIKILELKLRAAKLEIDEFRKERENLWGEIRHLNDERDSFIHAEEVIKEMRDFEYNDKSDAYVKIKLLHKTISILRQKVERLESKTNTLHRSGRGYEKENKVLRKEQEEIKNKIIELNRNIYEKVNKLNATPNGILCKLKKKNRQSLMVDEILNELRRSFLFCMK